MYLPTFSTPHHQNNISIPGLLTRVSQVFWENPVSLKWEMRESRHLYSLKWAGFLCKEVTKRSVETQLTWDGGGGHNEMSCMYVMQNSNISGSPHWGWPKHPGETQSAWNEWQRKHRRLYLSRQAGFLHQGGHQVLWGIPVNLRWWW